VSPQAARWRGQALRRLRSGAPALNVVLRPAVLLGVRLPLAQSPRPLALELAPRPVLA